jgi:pimeloyl-ACP methyl ester carboxylesterase
MVTTVLLVATVACRGERDGLADGRAPRDSATYAYREVRVRVDSLVTLAGELAMPAPAAARAAAKAAASAAASADENTNAHAIENGSPHAPRAAVLIIGGSGPQDRDGARPELPGYRPWVELRDALLRAGVAVLRLDDRGTGASSGRFAGATTDDFATDAWAALAWLAQQPGVAPARIALVGHSEGALVALLVAQAHPDAVRALVLLAAPSRTGRDIARWQRAALVASDGARWPPSQRRAALAAADSAADAAAQSEPWLRRWFALDPRVVAQSVHAPALLVHGGSDRQVPPSQADELAAALRGGGASPVQVLRVVDTNHLLLADADGDPQGYVRLRERRVQPAVLTAVVSFLSTHLITAPGANRAH